MLIALVVTRRIVEDWDSRAVLVAPTCWHFVSWAISRYLVIGDSVLYTLILLAVTSATETQLEGK